MGEASLVFSKNRKKCPDFGKKDPHCVHLQFKFSIQNIVLRVSTIVDKINVMLLPSPISPPQFNVDQLMTEAAIG